MGPSHPADRIFEKADTDQDGCLDRRELAQYMMTLEVQLELFLKQACTTTKLVALRSNFGFLVSA